MQAPIPVRPVVGLPAIPPIGNIQYQRFLLGADISNASSAGFVSVGLPFLVQPGELWHARYILKMASQVGAVGGALFKFVLPATMAGESYQWSRTSGTVAVQQHQSAILPGAAGVLDFDISASDQGTVAVEVILNTVATVQGLVDLLFAPVTNANTYTVKSGSLVLASRIPS